MPRLKVLSGDDVLEILREFGFVVVSQRGSHVKVSRNVNALPGTPLTFPGLDAFPVVTIDDLNSLTYGPVGPSGSTQESVSRH